MTDVVRTPDELLSGLPDLPFESVTRRPTRGDGRGRDDTSTEALANATSTDLATGCSFCGKPRPQQRKLIAGPGVNVCDECVALCAPTARPWRQPSPHVLHLI